jgi:hypothetical protein
MLPRAVPAAAHTGAVETAPATGPWTTATLVFFVACAATALGMARRRRDP